jgi:transcriptional antiterminator RfaH
MTFIADNGPRWYCIRTQPRREHVAAANLRQLGEVAVFHPRLRVHKATRRGPVWFHEPLFPGYMFARFILSLCIDKVRYAGSVADIVHFGGCWPAVPDEVMRELQSSLAGEEVYEVPSVFHAGDEVRIAEGPLIGLAAIVRRYIPASRRVQVLLDFLGQGASVELDAWSVARPDVSHRPRCIDIRARARARQPMNGSRQALSSSTDPGKV